MLPVIILAAVAVPLVVIAFFGGRKSVKAGEHPAGETQADRDRTEHEFEEAERYQAEWRQENKPHDPLL